jgi:hypothetical protein
MSQSELAKLVVDLHDKRDGARYYDRFIEQKDQAEFFEQAAKVIDDHVETRCISMDDHDHEIAFFREALQSSYNEIMILVEDLKDKNLTFTRGGLQTRLDKLLKKMKDQMK